MTRLILFAILILLFQTTEGSSKFDNAIIGQPYISCQRDRIIVEVITERLFTGKIFVKGDYANSQCTKSFRNGSPIHQSDKTGNEEEAIFLGTVTKSREPLMEDLEVAEAFLMQKSNLTEDAGEWKGVGGASAGPNAIFGGTRGEELRIFGKNGIQTTQKPGKNGRKESQSTTSSPVTSSPSKMTSSSKNSENAENCAHFCAPCECEDKTRSRRATNSIRLEVPLNSCNSKRDRKLNPPSVVVSLVAVVSFHDSFITKLDKAYHIQCAYAEAEKTVSTDLDVDMSSEQELNSTVEAPTCDYVISDKNGKSVQNSLVGELVRHQWRCSGNGNLKMLVHQCFVKDGSGQQFEVIDRDGCTMDPLMLQTPSYSADGLSATVDAFVFKFPDRATVDFRCTISFCDRNDKECQRVTPPTCSDSQKRAKRSPKKYTSMSLHSNSLTVFDVDSQMTSSTSSVPDDVIDLPTPSKLTSSDPEFHVEFCVSVASFGILVSASTFFTTISLAVIFSFFFFRFNEKISFETY